MTLTITAPAYENNAPMPKSCTCQGENMSPALAFSGVPEGTKSLALIIDDPDAPDPAAPKIVFVHWVLFNLPPDIAFLEAGQKIFPQGAREGLNDAGGQGYTGPCPPIGVHRYFHKLYALDTMLNIPASITKQELLSAMGGHVLAEAVLIGTYKKGN